MTVKNLSKLRAADRCRERSTINDVACFVVVIRRQHAEGKGLAWLALIGIHDMVAGPDSSLHFQIRSLSRSSTYRPQLG